ncbi:phage portal protein [Sporolactobacillus shoreicorticis]|uniref:Phage portal protein n=1 Tax=Sporolactobacillus shoreicorticis TaxID=1923877 RepID=A0ABW5S6C4_9BACL|nr:phage portal protein [Sporolactobacillus shoreicorticis]MCO7126631.1 phage portal protein [Sporolactobacillus shoreicorticis]
MFFKKLNETRSRSLGSGNNDFGLAFINEKVTIGSTSISPYRAMKNSDIFAAVNLLSSHIAACPFKILNGNEPVLEYLLNDRPNNLTNGFTFWQSVMTHLLLHGNAYCIIYRDQIGTPIKLEFVSGNQVNVLLSDDSQNLFYQFNFNDNRKPTLLNSSDVLHIRLISTDGGILGKSPLISLIPELDLQERVNKLTLNSLDKAISPAGILKIDKGILDHQAKENIRSEFEKSNTGANAGRVMVLDQIMTYQGQEINADILKTLITQVNWSRQQIAKVFGIPADMLGAESSHSNIDQIRGLYATSINRYTYPLTSEITNKLLTDPNETTRLDIAEVIDPDNSSAVKNLDILTKDGIFDTATAKSILYAKGGI